MDLKLLHIYIAFCGARKLRKHRYFKAGKNLLRHKHKIIAIHVLDILIILISTF